MSTWRLDGFTEVGELGSGAQGRVVLARRGESGPYVAIKYLPGGDVATRVPSRHEARLLAEVDDPHVARLYELVEGPAGAAMVMEAVAGVSLNKLLSRHGTLEPEAALVVLKGSLLGLAAAHVVGIVHRDYKPANVIVQADGVSKLIDFGVATRSGERSLAGTPVYMAPEQWGGAPATAATDVYAATCVFYECVTGSAPYRGDSQMVLMAQHATAPVPVEQVPPPLRELVAHGMAKEPERRPASAGEFVAELEAAAVAAYGEDWERRGLLALGAAAAALAALFPQAVATGQAGTSMATTSLGMSGLGGAAAAGGALGRAARRAGRSKLATMVGIAVVATVVVAAALVYVFGSAKTPIDLTGPTSSPGTPSAPATSPTPGAPSPSPSSSPSPSASPSDSGATPIVAPPAPPTRGPTAGPTDPGGPGGNGQGGGDETPPPPVPCPPWVIPAYDFGEVEIGRTLSAEFTFPWLECDDEQNIRIQGPGRDGYAPPALTSCPPDTSLGPCDFRVTFRPTEANQTYQATVVIPDDDGDPAVTLQITGRGVGIDNCPRQNLPAQSFGDVAPGESAERALSLSWDECYNAAGMRVEGDEAFSLTSTNCPPGGGSRCAARVRFAPAALGEYSATLLVPNDAGEIVVRIPLTGDGAAPPCPQQNPPAQSFGSTESGEAVQQEILLSWNDCYDAAGIRVEGDQAFSLTSTDCPPEGGSQCTVSVRFEPPTPGEYSATLLVPDDAGEIAVRIPLTGTGEPSACPQQNVPGHSFGTVTYGESVSERIVIPWNECYDRSISVEGDDAFSYEGTSCPPVESDSCSVTVTFTPESDSESPEEETFHGAVIIRTDDGREGVRIALDGTGAPPPSECPEQSPEAVSFGPTEIGDTETRSVGFPWYGCYNVGSLQISGDPEFSVEDTSCPAEADGDFCKVVVTFAPTSYPGEAGAFNATLTLADDAGATVVTVPLRGTVAEEEPGGVSPGTTDDPTPTPSPTPDTPTAPEPSTPPEEEPEPSSPPEEEPEPSSPPEEEPEPSSPPEEEPEPTSPPVEPSPSAQPPPAAEPSPTPTQEASPQPKTPPIIR